MTYERDYKEIIMVTLIIPFYNCEKQVCETLNRVKDFLKEHKDTEFIAVNDGSTDKTGEILKAYEEDCVRVAGYAENKGKGGAIREGVRLARGDKIIFTDADLAYGLEPFDGFAAALDDADIVVGSRRKDAEILKRYGVIRAVSSGLFSAACEMILGLELDDTQCGFKGFTSNTAKPLFEKMTITDFGFDFEILAMARQNGCKIKSLPVTLLKNSPQSTVSVMGDGLKMLREIYSIRKNLQKEKEKYII